MHGLWKTWLNLWCWGVILFGAVLVSVALPAVDGAARLILAIIGGTGPGSITLDQPGLRFAFALQGALTIGWTISVFGLIHAAETAGTPAWRALTLSVLTWFVIDSTASVATGVPRNAVSNSILLAAFLVPILASGVLRGAETMAEI